MFKNIKRKIIVASAVLLLASSITTKAAVIHDQRETEVIASGVTHVTIDQFTTNGFIDIQVLKLDTKNKFSGLTPLVSNTGTSSRATLSSMMKANSDVVGGINGDFFTYTRYPMALGSLYADDQLVLTTPEAAFARNNLYIRKDGTSGVGNIPNNITLQNISKAKIVNVNALNKVSAPYRAVSMLDHNWGMKSPGRALGAGVTEVLIENNTVKGVQTGGNGFPLKKGSYVLIQIGDHLKDFKVGDKINLNLGAYNNLKFSIGGGSILVKDSKVQQKGLNNARAPRTAIGINRAGTEILMVTVDGRNGKSIGMTELELANFMRSIGCKDAINLDGGGSTTMATKKSKEEVKVTNNPSGGSERAVANGVGIKSNAPESAPDYIKLETSTTEVFPGFSYKFTATVYDKYHNKLEVPRSDIKVMLGDKEVTGDHIIVNKDSSDKLVATTGNARGELELTKREPFAEIFANTDKIRLDYNEKFTLKDFYGIDKSGYKKSIPDSMINISTVGDIGTINNTTLTGGTEKASGAVVLKFGDAVKFIPVALGHEVSETTRITGEDINVKTYPEDPTIVVGRNEESETDAKVSFSVLWHKEHRNILIDLINPIDLKEADRLSLILKGSNHPIRLQGVLTDPNGKRELITLADKMSFADTREISADLPAGSWILQGFIVNVDHNGSYKGDIEINNISTMTYSPIDMSQAEESTRLVDPLNYSQEGNRLTVGSSSNGKIKSYLESANFGFSYNENHKYNVKRSSNTVFVTLEHNGKSLRATNPNQWAKFLSEVDNSKEKNFVIICHKDPLQMTGAKEKALFEQKLQELVSKGKNVFLIIDGNSASVALQNGYRKVTLDPKGSDNKVLDILVNGDSISYILKSI